MLASGSPVRHAQLWAGVECTVNRVGESFLDQVAMSGHHSRVNDLDRIAELGASAIRYPVLWERTAPNGVDAAEWSWPDERLACLHRLGIRPIVGLVHHGSGPSGTDLLDPQFPEKLAAYAGAVARRYPFVEDWTPLNEVITTARFSGLYGLWFPHGRDNRIFVRAVLNQCRAVVLAMRAVRSVNSRARLVQTEDVGRIYSTPQLARQARYENGRQLLALDLLSGRVDEAHPMWTHLLSMGATAPELEAFCELPCPPDVVGLNYYLTSDRFLDHRVDAYPEYAVGGNERQRYADVEAVRVAGAEITGHERLLQGLWDRYRTPLAITEVHVGCTPEEQIRWFAEAWGAAARARTLGVEVEAVTAWAALGTFDWDKLVTRFEGQYEPGLFDVREDPPALTPLGHFVGRVGCTGELTHAALASPGWWRRSSRVLYPLSANSARERAAC